MARLRLRRIALGFLLLFTLLASFLAEAHWEIRRVAPVLPSDTELAAFARDAGDAPVSIRHLNTATQRTPRGVMWHPAFVLEWSDGRLFLVDVGMEPAGARSFGAPMELLLGAEPIGPRGSVGEQLGADAARVAGVAFTHLHLDHTGGLGSLCRGRTGPLPAYQTPWQAERDNYSTLPGRNDLEAAACARPTTLRGGPVLPVPGFPGLAAIAAGGHTPGSTLYLARVGDVTWLLSGDVTNELRSIRENLPKPALYSLLVVPESTARTAELRTWLARLDSTPPFRLAVSHDGMALEASGMPAWVVGR